MPHSMSSRNGYWLALACVLIGTAFAGGNPCRAQDAAATPTPTGASAIVAETAAPVQQEAALKAALDVAVKTHGETHEATILALLRLAEFYCQQGSPAAATPLLRRAVAAEEQIGGPAHPVTLDGIEKLAGVYGLTGEYARAEPLLRRLVKARARKLGDAHPDTLQAAMLLARVCEAQGKTVVAEQLFREVLAQQERTLGDRDPQLLSPLLGLAGLLQRQGDYTAAEKLFKRAVAIQETVAGKEHPDTLRLTGELAMAQAAAGNDAAAEALLRQLLVVQERVLPPDDPDLAQTLNNLGQACWARGDVAAAKPLFTRALELRERRLGAAHPATLQSAACLAMLYYGTGNYAAAEPLFQRVQAGRERLWGRDDPETVRAANNLAYLYLARGEVVAAWGLLAASPDAPFQVQARLLTGGTERQRLAAVAGQTVFWASRSLALSLLAQQPLSAEIQVPATRLAATAVLRGKAVVLDSLLEDRDRLLGAAAAQVSYDRLQALRDRLATLTLNPPRPPTGANIVVFQQARQTELNTLTAECEKQEAELAGQAAVIGGTRRALRITWGEVQRGLVPDTALVEFIAFPLITKAPPGQPPPAPAMTYAALVLRHTGEPEFVFLGPAAEIDQAVAACREAGGRQPKGINGEAVGIHGTGPQAKKNRAEQQLKLNREERQLWEALYARLWQPLAGKVQGCQRVYVSPDGDLNFIPFGALRDAAAGQWLAERHEIGYLTSGRDLVRAPVTAPVTGTDALFGDPDFNVTAKRPGGTPTPTGTAAARSLVAAAAPVPLAGPPDAACRDYLRGQAIWALPETRREVDGICALLVKNHRTVEVACGQDATKTRLKTVEHPGILHLATHGFFIPMQAGVTAATRDGAGDRDMAELLNLKMGTVENPMLRAGLLLAGAKAAVAGSVTKAGDDDGILTAQEASYLKLAGTDLAVLSCCETGLGENRSGEGVQGLRRAFGVAGVRQLVMSLWAVSDANTSTLMQEFYGEYLKSGDAVAAMTQVQRQHLRAAAAAPDTLAVRDWAAFLVSLQARPNVTKGL